MISDDSGYDTRPCDDVGSNSYDDPELTISIGMIFGVYIPDFDTWRIEWAVTDA